MADGQLTQEELGALGDRIYAAVVRNLREKGENDLIIHSCVVGFLIPIVAWAIFGSPAQHSAARKTIDDLLKEYGLPEGAASCRPDPRP